MSKLESNWQYAEQYPQESNAMTAARHLSLELGITTLTKAVAAQVSQLALLMRAQNICELGTGVGLSALALLRYLPQAHLTSIDVEGEYHREARKIFLNAGIIASRLRLIEGDAQAVLPRLNTGSYDLLLIDANPEALFEHVEYGLQVIRPGGSVLIPNALRDGRVPDPANRDDVTTIYRDLLAVMCESNAVCTSLSPIGNGLLTLTRLS